MLGVRRAPHKLHSSPAEDAARLSLRLNAAALPLFSVSWFFSVLALEQPQSLAAALLFAATAAIFVSVYIVMSSAVDLHQAVCVFRTGSCSRARPRCFPSVPWRQCATVSTHSRCSPRAACTALWWRTRQCPRHPRPPSTTRSPSCHLGVSLARGGAAGVTAGLPAHTRSCPPHPCSAAGNTRRRAV